MIPEHTQTVHCADPNITGRALCDAPNPITTKHPHMVNCRLCVRHMAFKEPAEKKARTA